jgi:hypothetical protein
MAELSDRSIRREDMRPNGSKRRLRRSLWARNCCSNPAIPKTSNQVHQGLGGASDPGTLVDHENQAHAKGPNLMSSLGITNPDSESTAATLPTLPTAPETNAAGLTLDDGHEGEVQIAQIARTTGIEALSMNTSGLAKPKSHTQRKNTTCPAFPADRSETNVRVAFTVPTSTNARKGPKPMTPYSAS